MLAPSRIVQLVLCCACMRSRSLSHDDPDVRRATSARRRAPAAATRGTAAPGPATSPDQSPPWRREWGQAKKRGQPVGQQSPPVAAVTEAAAATATASTYCCNCGPPARRPGSEEQPALTQAQMNAYHNPPCCMALNFMPKTLTNTRVNMRSGSTEQPTRACVRARCCCKLLQLSGSRLSSPAFPVHHPGQAQ